MGCIFSCETDESTCNAGVFSCTVKHLNCFGKKDRQNKDSCELGKPNSEMSQAPFHHPEQKPPEYHTETATK